MISGVCVRPVMCHDSSVHELYCEFCSDLLPRRISK